MKCTIIWIADEKKKANEKTLSFLKKELASAEGRTQVLLYAAGKALAKRAVEEIAAEAVEGFSGAEECRIYEDAAARAEGEWITQLYGGDVWSDGTLAAVAGAAKSYSSYRMLMLRKIMPGGEEGAFSDPLLTKNSIIRLDENYKCHPFYFGGTFVKRDLLRTGIFQPELGLDAERKLFLGLGAKEKRVVFLPGSRYFSVREREGDHTFFHGIYEKSFYLDSYTEFWLPWLSEWREKTGGVPELIQYHYMFSSTRKLLANLNNQNKHVLDEEEAGRCLALIGEGLKLLDDTAVFNARKVPDCIVADTFLWFLGILKYGEDFRFDRGYLGGKTYYKTGEISFNVVGNLKTNILFMEARNGILEIDGTIHAVLFSMADHIYFEYAGEKYEPEYNERYALTKTLGISICKNHSFHVSIPYRRKLDSTLYCFARFGKDRIKIPFKFESHFSRMSNRFENQYWAFRDEEKDYMMLHANDGLKLIKSGRKLHAQHEWKLYKEMFAAPMDRKRAWLFILIRLAFFALRPVMKKRPIWMYLDKIYKAGDSAEYLYRYASKQDNNFKHYYLVDKKSPDYARLKREGFHPLVRGSIKHRLIFLMADMMVISNSTVFAFNDFGMINSSYVRDLPDFHVCCVQHGMSVQKIAVAQNRLRDNTRLYFCASRYELENLSRPVYDYQGYGALKLTGVPRYDGLVNRDQRQILISPTWRMQAAVPVRGSEGQSRDYNPLFRESSYFKVYNSLINDPRLIEAAKRYGYKIKYVLHPIVSSQLKDFDTNEFVDIIPAAGDMSYEKMFCESSLMVTDFSGVQFDFAYMRKPVVYLHHRDIPQHYEEGSFFYDTMGFGEICTTNDELIDLLIGYMADNCRMKEEYVRRADDFFYYSDRNNCERIYRIMVAYQNSRIFPGVGRALAEQYVAEHPFVEDTPAPSAQLLREKEQQGILQGEFSLAEQKELAAQADALIASEGLAPGKPSASDRYYNNQVEEKTILMLGLGHNVRGSLQYILNELNYSDRFEGYRVFIRGWKPTEQIVKQYIKENHWDRSTVLIGAKQYDEWLERAQYLLTETYFPEGWTKKPGQTVINIWHGTPLKKLGLAKNFRNLHKDGATQKNFIEADYVLYPNEYTRDNLLRSYKVADLMTGRIVMLGYPRTGGMLAVTEEEKRAVRAALAPGGEHLYAYMPTWKDYLEEEDVIRETREFLEFLDTHLGDDQILYSNLHHKVSDSLDYSGFRHIRQFPPNLDSYKLLAATDALITDYSSVFYDYLATRKQIILFCEDYELYEKRRGTYMDLMSLPFDKARSKEEVVEALRRGKTYDDTAAYEQFCRYDSPENARKLCSLFTGTPDQDVILQEIPKSGKKQVMFYSERFQNASATADLAVMAKQYDREKNQLTFSCQMFEVDKHKDSAYPLLRENPVIGTTGEYYLSSRGKVMLEMFREGKTDFDTAMKTLRYDYALSLLREFGHARWDLVVLYDIVDPQRLLALSELPANRVLFVTEEMLDRVRLGDRLMTEAIRYSAQRCSAVYTFGEEVDLELRWLLPDFPETTVYYEPKQLLNFFD